MVLRVRGVCFSTSDRAIVLPEVGMTVVNKRQAEKRTVDMNAYKPEPEDTSAPPRGVVVNPAQRAIEEIKKHAGMLERYHQQLELQQADQERFDRLNDQNATLVQQVADMSVWMNMIKDALRHHDDGELSSRQFANEVDSAIKGWEGK